MKKAFKKEVLTVVSIVVWSMVGILAGLIMIAVLHGCTTVPASPATPVPVPVSAPVPEPVISKGCTAYAWRDRGKAPIGFFKGMIASYRQAQCTPTAASGPISDKVCRRNADGSIKYYCDALKNYRMAGGNELLKTYTFLIGLAQRESSGNYTEGLDVSSDQPWTAERTEAGAFQISYDGMNAHPELKQIYERYRAHPELCLKDVYSEGVKIKSGGYIGSGPGREFQEFVRSCPGIQAPLAAIYIRFLSNHFGPINLKKVEYNADCESMLKANESKCQ